VIYLKVGLGELREHMFEDKPNLRPAYDVIEWVDKAHIIGHYAI